MRLACVSDGRPGGRLRRRRLHRRGPRLVAAALLRPPVGSRARRRLPRLDGGRVPVDPQAHKLEERGRLLDGEEEDTPPKSDEEGRLLDEDDEETEA